MRSVLFMVLCFLIVAATVVVYFAIGMQSQAPWASDVRRLAQPCLRELLLLLAYRRDGGGRNSFPGHADDRYLGRASAVPGTGRGIGAGSYRLYWFTLP
jgi:hypothetical protein